MATSEKFTPSSRHRRRLHRSLAAGFFLSLALSLAPSSQAQVFNPHRILTDQELADATSLSAAAMQRFFERQGSVLATFQETVEGRTLSAAQLIRLAAQRHRISPKFLLAVLEREKGLLRKKPGETKPADLDWAAGYSCFAGRCNEKYRGFFNQVESAAITQNIYRERAGTFPFQAGVPAKTRDGFAVTPQNQATANLYIYTPYVGHAPELGIVNFLGGNRLFHQIWQRFFTDARYPDGLLLTDGTRYWRLEGGAKRRFTSSEVFLADYAGSDAIAVNDKTLQAYPEGPEIRYANHTLVRSSASGQAVLLQDGKQRPIVDEPALALLSEVRLAVSSFSDISTVPAEHLAPYPIGAPITAQTTYPQGKLFRNEAGGLVWVQDGVQHPIDPSVASRNFPRAVPEPPGAAALARFPLGEPLRLRDGTFAKTADGGFYLISNGERRKILSAEVFDRVFGATRREATVLIPPEVLNLHAAGLNIDYIDDTLPDPPEPAVLGAAEGPTYRVGITALEPNTMQGVVGQTLELELRAANSGTATWEPGSVHLKVNAKEPINFREASVPPGASATFPLALTLQGEPGLQPQVFALTRQDGEVLTRFAQFALLKPAQAATIVEHNLPVAVKNTWRVRPVVVKLKNASANLTWRSAKTALTLATPDGKVSPFYDVNDWVKPNVPAVPIKRKTVPPGETAEFRFTLKPRGLKPGVYELRFTLELLEVGKTIPIDGQEVWTRKIRVDK